MPRLHAVEPATADPKAQPVLENLQKSLGKVPNLFRTVSASPAALDGLVQLRGALARGHLRLPVREAIAIALAEEHGCDYCLSAHVASAGRAGLSDDSIDEIRAGRSSDPKMNAAVAFALAVARNRGNVSDADLERVREAGYNDADIVELVANVTANVFTNYMNNVARTEIDSPVVRTRKSVHA